MPGPVLPWDKVATSDAYRNMGVAQRAQVQSAWMSEIAPQMYPGIQQDPTSMMKLSRYMQQWNLPAPSPIEKAVLTPNRLNMDSFSQVETDPKFAKLGYQEQQNLKQIWYKKSLVSDPQLQQLNPEQQQNYYQKLMTRGPSLSSTLFSAANYDKSAYYGDIKAFGTTSKVLLDVAKSIDEGFFPVFGSLVVGPITKLAGPNSQFSRTVQDVSKLFQYADTMLAPQDNFFTSTLPRIAGSLTGYIAGPAGALGKALGGGMKASLSAGKLFEMSPGLLEKAGRALGSKLPSILYQTAGGTAAGALQGVTQALEENKDWKTYLPQDIALGATMEFTGRYFAMSRVVRRAAKLTGENPKQFFGAPLKLGAAQSMPDALKKLSTVSPTAFRYVQDMRAVDPNGFLLQQLSTKQGVKAMADHLGIKTDIGTDHITLKTKNGKVQTFTGNDVTQVRNSLDWLDANQNVWDNWEKSLKNKGLQEAIATAPRVEARMGYQVPEVARDIMRRTLKKYQVNIAPLISANHRDDTAFLDELYGITRKLSANKAAQGLKARGVEFSPDAVKNLEAVKQFKHQLAQVLPDNAYVIVNRDSGNVVDVRDIPALTYESPDVAQPFMYSRVFAGRPADVAQALGKLEKTYARVNRAVREHYNGRSFSLKEYKDNQILEMKISVPDGNGNNHDILYHFNSLKAAREAITLGTNRGLKGLAKSLFADNKFLDQSYNDFTKAFRKRFPDRYKTDFLPYQFTAAQAKQQGFYLGAHNGRYVLQDASTDVPSWREFNDLHSVLNYLGGADSRAILPDMTSGMARDAVETEYKRGITQLQSDMTPLQIKSKPHFTLLDELPRRFANSEYVMQRFERLQQVQDLKKRFGFSPMAIYNDLRTATRRTESFINQRQQFIRGLSSGVKAHEADFVSRYMEAAVSPDELAHPLIRGMTKELRSDVFDEMVQKYGKVRADALAGKASTLSNFYDDMFAVSGMDGKKFLKYYHPHMAAQMRRTGNTVNSKLYPDRITQIPKADKQFFFEMMREGDSRSFLWDTNAFSVANRYTQMLGRLVHERPTMQAIGNHVRKITAALKKSGADMNDYNVVANYIGKMFESIDGIHAESDRIFQVATANTLRTLADSINSKFGTKINVQGRFNLVNSLISLTSGSFLAARPFQVFRNLTQSLLTGGTIIGDRWWMEGLDAAARPGAVQKLQDLGMIIQRGASSGTAGMEIAGGGINTLIKWGMEPYRWSDNVNRAVVYFGMERRAESAWQQFLKDGNTKRFLHNSGATLFGKAHYNELTKLLDTTNPRISISAFKDRLAQIASDRTQFLYESFNKPQMFRSGIGRLFGQYGTWTVSFYNMMKSMLLSDTATIGQKIGALARLGTSTYAVAGAMHQAGINPNSTAPWNSMVLSGGPYYQLINQGLQAANGDTTSLSHFVKNLISIYPFAYEGDGIERAVQALQDGDIYEAILHVASAPIRTDVYPRRQVYTDTLARDLVRKLTPLVQRDYSHDFVSKTANTIYNTTGIDVGVE